MKNYFYIIFLISCLFSCNEEISNVDVDSFLVRGDRANTILLETISENIEYLSLKWPNNITISKFTNIKIYDDLIFVHDRDGTMTITVFDIQGNYVNRLSKVGKGPGEYLDLEAFSYDANKNELITYSRELKSFNFYKFPEMEFVRTLDKAKYIINFEVIQNDRWLVICDEEFNDKFHGIEQWDEEHISQPINKLIKRDPISVEMSFPNTFTRNHGRIFYANPHEITTIFEFEKEGFIPVLEIDFGKNKIPAQHWETPYIEKFEQTLEEGGKKSFWVQNAIFGNSNLSFWFYYGDFENTYLAICDRTTKKSTVYSEVNLKDMNITVAPPITTADDTYISLLYPALMDTVGISRNLDLMNAYNESAMNSSPILLFFKLEE